MTPGRNYIILTATLCIEKQMWLVFCLYVLFSDAYRHSTEGVPCMSVFSNSHFFIKT